MNTYASLVDFEVSIVTINIMSHKKLLVCLCMDVDGVVDSACGFLYCPEEVVDGCLI
jgi:hypothetical protein